MLFNFGDIQRAVCLLLAAVQEDISKLSPLSTIVDISRY